MRELKEKFLRSKNIPSLSNVDDIHAICGLLKDFLRNLKEPLLTFRLNKTFMEAAGKETESDIHVFQRLNDRFVWHVSWQTSLLLLQLCCGCSGCWGDLFSKIAQQKRREIPVEIQVPSRTWGELTTRRESSFLQSDSGKTRGDGFKRRGEV